MAKTVLITGSETPLGRKLMERYLAQGFNVVAPQPQIGEGEEAESEGRDNCIQPPWNRSSFFSSKTVVREGLRIFRTLDEAVILNPMLTSSSAALGDISIPEIDDHLESGIHGTVYMIKEILDHFTKTGSGLLSFALSADDNTSSIFQRSADGFFRSFVQSILNQRAEGIFCSAYISFEQNSDLFAEFIHKYNTERIDKAAGQWLKFSEKKSLFSSLPILKKDF